MPMPTLMRQEIEEEPAVVERLLRDAGPELDAAAAAIRGAQPRYVAVVARGTSDHAAIYARYLAEVVLGLPSGLSAASVTTLYHAPIEWRDVLLIAISQSGAGPDVVEVVETARRGGALTLAITNDPASSLAAASTLVLDCLAGQERSVAATKTYTAELATIAAVILRVGERRADLGGLDRVPEAIRVAIDISSAWLAREHSLVEALSGSDRALVVSRGFNLATALEIALKLKETSRIFGEGYSSADLLHGPIVLVEPDVPILAIRPDGPVGAAIDAGVDAAVRAGARPWLVGGSELHASERSIAIDHDLPEYLTPLPFVVPGQLVAEQVSRARGFSPDEPPGLSKVTLTR
jgi:glucosamine--fructose-6-phosphate aminotransferase (isomerizing)